MSTSKGENYKVVVYERRFLPPLDTVEVIAECKQKETLTARITMTLETSRDWREGFISYYKYGILPEDPGKRVIIKRRLPHYYYNEDLKTLYYRSHEGILWRCLSQKEAMNTLTEMHDGVCRAHQPGPKLCAHIRLQGYYWPTMVQDFNDYDKRCEEC